MVRHIVSWNYGDGFSDEHNRQNALKIKGDLEALFWKLDGISELTVYIDTLPSSNRDVVLNSLFESKEALEAYQKNPDHMRVSKFVGSVMKDRICVDYEEL